MAEEICKYCNRSMSIYQLRKIKNGFVCKDEDDCLSSQDKSYKKVQQTEKQNSYVRPYYSALVNETDHSDAHPFWHAVLFLGLITIFFPWSLLLLLVIFGWEGSVQLLRGLVIGAVGLVFILLWVAIIVIVSCIVLVAIFG